jgi:RNA polymerase sigma factor (sigma-70 family)
LIRVSTHVDEEILAAVAKFANPKLGLRATEDELIAWATAGATMEPPLTPEAAIRRMIPTKHLGMLRQIAKRRIRPTVDMDDLIGAGTFGLIRAAEKFDPDRGFRFSTYAHRWIRSKMRSYSLDVRRPIRVPLYVHKLVEKLRADPKLWEDLPDRDREFAEFGEVVLGSGVIRDGLGDEFGSGSILSRLVGDDGPGPGRGADLGVVESLLSAVPSDRDRAIVADYYGLGGREPVSSRRLAGRFGIGESRVRQVLEAARRSMLAEADRLGLSLDDCLMVSGDVPRDPASLARPASPRQYRGVRLRSEGRWGGVVAVRGIKTWVGTYDEQEECRAAVDRFALERFGIEDYTDGPKRQAGRSA